MSLLNLQRMASNQRLRSERTERKANAVLVFPNPEIGIMRPWDIRSIDPAAGKVTFAAGDVEVHGDIGTDYYTPASLEVTLSDGENYVFVAIDPEAETPAATMGRDANKPESDTDTYKKLLWRIDYDATGKSVTPMVQYWNANVEVPPWAPPFE